MSVTEEFERWRKRKGPEDSWGLAWFLASQLCQRFYASHGIVPYVIVRSGLGYYGIALQRLPCKVSSEERSSIGRLTMGGNAEDWRRGSDEIGGHGLNLITKCESGAPTSFLVGELLRYFDFPIYPPKGHLHCRHKRWGASYQLCFDIATILALRHENIFILNNPDHVAGFRDFDKSLIIKEDPGTFVITANANTVILRGDGNLIAPERKDLWNEYMRGMSVKELADIIEGLLGLCSKKRKA